MTVQLADQLADEMAAVERKTMSSTTGTETYKVQALAGGSVARANFRPAKKVAARLEKSSRAKVCGNQW